MTTTKRTKRFINVDAKPPERKASEPLHVMLEPRQMERYRALQQGLNLPMREVVVLAMDILEQKYRAQNERERQATRAQRPDGDRQTSIFADDDPVAQANEDRVVAVLHGGHTNLAAVRDLVLSLAQRMNQVEFQVDFLLGEHAHPGKKAER